METLWSLAVALGVPFSRLVEPPSAAVRVVRAGDGQGQRSEHADFVGTLLSAAPGHSRRDIYLIQVEPGPAREAAGHLPGTVEHLVVSSGRIRTGPTNEPVVLAPGDYAAFPANQPHVYQALEPGTSAVLIMKHR
ncbi:cupin domain-containing protein [Solwaraspora sp. WMMD406]|uniref:cupin domain-containing protein n=1 Tax=Solwaraspora sp. WMMD406 TaxID=3016095 RepID=UPI002416CCD6|nr:cupin domain-containing protein [Solwaraspora sp. WMMD406]MDG4765133.1 cupin domain-containing protein [Solwaraspora sp. WMMD406]